MNMRRPRNTVVYIRTIPGDRNVVNADLQEEIMLRFCQEEKLHVCSVIRSECPEEESISYLEQLIQELPPETDSMIAWRYNRYSSNLYELSRICFLYDYYGIRIYSMEFPTELWKNLNVLNAPYERAIYGDQAVIPPPVKNRVPRRG